MSDQINDCSFYFYFICANWNIVVKIVDIVIMAQDLIALCNFFIQLIYRDNMYIIPKKISRSGLWGSLLLYGGGKIWVIRLKVPYHALSA